MLWPLTPSSPDSCPCARNRGRGHETPGEDPFVCAEYGVELISGMQQSGGGNASSKYMQVVAIVKHSFDYDLEGNHGPADRTAFDANVSALDQNSYFWPPFEAAVVRARAGGLMCSYNGVNGVPSCMNGAVNNGLVREQWGLRDGVIVSDCGAIGDSFAAAYIAAHFGGDANAQVAQGLRGGCDFNCGKFYQAHLPSALAAGAVNATDIDVAVTRLLKKAFQLGLYDDPAAVVPFSMYGPEQLATRENEALALTAAVQSIVLLQNDAVATPRLHGGDSRPLLPLAPGAKVALIGPHANATTDMLSNYHGDNNLVFAHSPLLAMARRGTVLGHAAGSALWDPDKSGFGEATALAARADVAVLFLGLHPQWFDDVPHVDANEGEDRDRANITLPAVQLELLQAVAATGTPVVLVLINGGQLAIPWAKAHVPAIVEAFYPGQMGGDAIAAVLYGDASPSGRLPYTIYDADFTARRPDIGDMSLSARGGITYQYYSGSVLWRFGWGLSYTTFALAWRSAAHLRTTRRALLGGNSGVSGGAPAFVVTATNEGSVTSDLAVLAFVSADGAMVVGAPQPQRELFAFCRLRAVAPGRSAHCELAVAPAVLAHNATVFTGSYAVTVELGDGTAVAGSLLVAARD